MTPSSRRRLRNSFVQLDVVADVVFELQGLGVDGLDGPGDLLSVVGGGG
jgi:hypothetical protein